MLSRFMIKKKEISTKQNSQGHRENRFDNKHKGLPDENR